MSMYQPLTVHLRSLDKKEWHTSFSEISKILGFDLPASAYKYPAWWANQSGSGHSQTSSWQGAGWKTSDLDLRRQRVTFRFGGTEPATSDMPSPATFAAPSEPSKGMSIAEAKKALAAYFRVSEDQIEITIHG